MNSAARLLKGSRSDGVNHGKIGVKAACNIMSNSVAKIHPAGEPREQRFSLYAIDGGRKYLNRAERARVLAVMASLDEDKALFALTLAWTGARVSEVLALTPSSFQVESGVVAFSTLKRRRFCVREVPVPPSLIRALDDHFGLSAPQHYGVRQNHEEAKHNPGAARRRLWPWHRTTAWRLIKNVMGRAGVVGRPSCPRGLRHSFGVGTLQASVPLNLVQRWLGHARMSTTAIYADVSGPEERSFAERFWEPGKLELE